ncbi:MAG TPA: aminoglycoside phosphotransferase family protein [Acidimicrobiales bacterium]|nr:aminoglycoside phosphotransferase family protein [Acidimicrobiales bacterium]
MELLAEGRMAEVFAYGDGTVVKLDRPEWSGVSNFESDVLVRAAAARLPVAHSHGVVTIDGRCGVVLDRIHGRTLRQVLDVRAGEPEVLALAQQFVLLQQTINGTVMEGLPDLVTRLREELTRSGLGGRVVGALTDLLAELDDGQRGVCHFDFHSGNVLVGADGWIVIDWITVASGPPMADLARTLVLDGNAAVPPMYEFMQAVRRHGLAARHASDTTCDGWVRVAAGARLAEGFEGEYAEWLAEVAGGRLRLFV